MKLANGPARATSMRCQRGCALKSPGSFGGSFAGVVAGHLDVAAEGEHGDAVVGVATPEAEEALAEADGEDLDADAAELGNGEVAELVDQNHDAEDDDKLNDCRHGSEEDLVTGWRCGLP